MNIQAEDGKWYVDPSWVGYNYRVYAYLDDFCLNYKGRVLWATARRILQKLGIKAKLDMVKADSQIITKTGRLSSSSLFSLTLIRPIPVPEIHDGFFDEAPNPLYNGRTLSWKLSGKRWMPIGEKS